MLELYHGGPGANSLKSLLCLHEKGLEFTSHWINLAKFEQHDPEFVKLNPNGQVPVLVHDGAVINESTVINEYLEDVFPDVRLRPEDPAARARMRVWTKFVDEYFCPALSLLGWHRIIQDMVKDLTEEEFEEKLKRIPLKEQQDKWRLAAKKAFPQEQLDDASRRVRASVERMEAALAENSWVAGPDFTLADISCFAMAAPMPRFHDSVMNDKDTPNCMNWHARMTARPASETTFAMKPPWA